MCRSIFKEASYALGANRFQTIVRILVPASLSGIISAMLLGFGRVIGETMVVLLCAGNRIAIPDFTQGLGAFFQPVHTMTGIIAQEMGEVVPGQHPLPGAVHGGHRALPPLARRSISWRSASSTATAFPSAKSMHAPANPFRRGSLPPARIERVAFGFFRAATYFILLCAAVIFGLIFSRAAQTVFQASPPFVNCALPHAAAGDALCLSITKARRWNWATRSSGEFKDSARRADYSGGKLRLQRGRHLPCIVGTVLLVDRLDGHRALHRHLQRHLPERIQQAGALRAFSCAWPS